MRKLLIGLFVCGALLQAGLVVPDGPWQTVTTPVTLSGEKISSSVNANATSSAYWNNNTQDTGGCMNIGCFATKTGGFSSTSSSPALLNPVYLGNNDGTSVQNFYFAGDIDTPVQLLLEVAGNAGTNWLGWYDKSLAPGSFNTGNKGTLWDVIFTGDDTTSSGSSQLVTIAPGSNFGFWFLPGFSDNSPVESDAVIAARLNGGRSLFTEGGKNTGSNAYQQYFALFARDAAAAGTPPAEFWMGIEDLSTTAEELNGDFNDMVVKFTVVPEPGFYGALALGLAGLYAAARRKRS